MKKTTMLLALALALAAPWAGAADRPDEVQVLDVETFLAYQHKVRDEMTSGKKFRHVDNESRTRLFKAQDELFRLLDGKQSTDELGEAEKVAVFNAQNVVSAVLADAELDREVCKRERRLGSHQVSTTCMTVRERNEMQKLTQDDLRKRRAKGCGTDAGLNCDRGVGIRYNVPPRDAPSDG